MFCAHTALFFLSILSTASAAKDKLLHWYPQYGWFLNDSLHQTCWSEYQYYLHWHGDPPGPSTGITPVVSCILSDQNQVTLANMQSAGVILGLLPTVLALAGSSTVETGMLATRRPLLALLLGAGSPAVNPIRTFEYRSPEELLQFRRNPRVYGPPSHAIAIVLSAAQYLLAGAAFVNVVTVSLQLGLRTVTTFVPQASWPPVVWALLAIAVHTVGGAAVFLRVRVEPSPTKPGLWSKLKTEFTISSCQHDAQLSIRKESDTFTMISWITSTGTVLHIIYGIFTFSATLFINAADSLGVVGRYLASTLVCRIILTYEMNGMRQRVKVDRDPKDDGYPKDDKSWTSSG